MQSTHLKWVSLTTIEEVPTYAHTSRIFSDGTYFNLHTYYTVLGRSISRPSLPLSNPQPSLSISPSHASAVCAGRTSPLRQHFYYFSLQLASGVTSLALSADSQSSIRRLVSLAFGALSSLLGCAVLYLGLLAQSRHYAEPVLTTNFHFERNPSLWRASRKS